MAALALAPRTLLIRGMLVGVVGAGIAFLFARLFGEASIDQAIMFETSHTPAGAHDPAVVSRVIQSTVGLGTVVLVYGAAIGGIFALGFAVSHGRLGTLGIRTTSMVVAGIGFTAGYLVPFLKYPANPPATGDENTIGERTALYVLMIGISVAAAVGATLLARVLAGRLGAWDEILIALGAFVAVVALAMLVLPTVNEVPDGFPAEVLWRFRLASVGTQLVLWATIGLVFGALTEGRVRQRHLRGQPIAG
jgi:Probable cobalt transporter subunit (CbtA)